VRRGRESNGERGDPFSLAVLRTLVFLYVTLPPLLSFRHLLAYEQYAAETPPEKRLSLEPSQKPTVAAKRRTSGDKQPPHFATSDIQVGLFLALAILHVRGFATLTPAAPVHAASADWRLGQEESGQRACWLLVCSGRSEIVIATLL
jgi:hypothetical protein